MTKQYTHEWETHSGHGKGAGFLRNPRHTGPINKEIPVPRESQPLLSRRAGDSQSYVCLGKIHRSGQGDRLSVQVPPLPFSPPGKRIERQTMDGKAVRERIMHLSEGTGLSSPGRTDTRSLSWRHATRVRPKKSEPRPQGGSVYPSWTMSSAS